MGVLLKRIFLVVSVLTLSMAVYSEPFSDSLFNSKSKFKLLYLESGNRSDILRYISDTSGWISADEMGVDDIKGKNEILLKSYYNGAEYENPMIALTGYSGSFELYRDTVMIYSSGKYFNPDSENLYFDSHFVFLQKPLNGCCFTLRLHFKSYLDISGFSVALVGDAGLLADKVVDENRKMLQSALPELFMGIFLLIAGIFAIVAFFIRFRQKDWLLFWFFVFSASQGYVFILEYIYMLVNISPVAFLASTIIVNNLVPVGILGIVARISGLPKNIMIKIMIGLHLIYTTLHLVMIQYEIFNGLFWLLLVIDIIIFVVVLIKSRIYKNRDFLFPVIALCILMILVILDIFAVFGVFFIAEDLSSYGMLLLTLSFAQFIERALYKSRKQNFDYEMEIQQTRNRLLSLENENVIAQYEALKNQVNPHFLFNSLNVLSSLIRLDDKKALRFIEEFADIYRYVLDANDKTLVEAEKELAFVRSYIFLQQLRYGKNLVIEPEHLQCEKDIYVVPLSVQILVENAIKHNEISAEYPLKIKISVENDYIVVTNTVRKLNYKPESNGIGLKNLSERYALLTSMETSFFIQGDEFIAKIPLIKSEDNENSDN